MSTPLDNDPKPTSTNGRCPECDSLMFKKMAETRNTVECCSCRLIYIRLTGCDAFRYESKRKGRPTPETDAVFMTIAVGDFIDPHKDALRFARDHCEELECQRDEARELCDFNAKQLLVAVNERNSLVVQRGRLLEALDDAKPLLIGIESDLGEPSHRRERAKRLLRAFESAIAEVKGSR